VPVTPTVRLILRALLVGVASAAGQLQGSSSWDRSILVGAIVAGVLAAAEFLTPLNAVVGVNKTSSVTADPPKAA